MRRKIIAPLPACCLAFSLVRSSVTNLSIRITSCSFLQPL